MAAETVMGLLKWRRRIAWTNYSPVLKNGQLDHHTFIFQHGAMIGPGVIFIHNVNLSTPMFVFCTYLDW